MPPSVQIVVQLAADARLSGVPLMPPDNYMSKFELWRLAVATLIHSQLFPCWRAHVVHDVDKKIKKSHPT